MTIPGARLAQAASDADDYVRLAARDFAEQGVAAFEREEYATALGLFQRAEQLVPVPTISLYVGRSLQRVGRWIEAAEVFRRCAGYAIESDSPPPFIEAVRDAKVELAALLPRIPRVMVIVQPELRPDSGIDVTLDGVPLSAAMIGVAFPIDPGAHEFRATNSAGARASARVEALPARSRRVTLRLAPHAPTAAGRLDAASTRHGVPSDDERGSSARRTHRTLGFSSLVVGGAALATGLATGVMALDKHEDARRLCPGLKCEAGSPGEEALNSFRTFRTASTVSYIGGAAFLATGTILLLVAPSGPTAQQGHLSPYLGLGSAGVAGSF